MKQELNQEGRMINTNNVLLMRASSLKILKQVSEEVLKDSMTLQRLADIGQPDALEIHQELTEQKRKQANRLSKRETFIDLKKLIQNTEAKTEELIQQ